MTEQELKDKIKPLGTKTQVRNKQKLISLLKFKSGWVLIYI